MKKSLYLIFIILCALNPGCSSDKGHTYEQSGEIHSSDEAGQEVSHDSSGYSIISLKSESFAFTIRAGGRILVDSKDIIIITAKSSGIVKMSDDYLFPGVRVSKGQILFTVSGAQLAEDNTELNFRQIKADFSKDSANYERARKLIAEKIISEEQFLSMKNQYEKSLNAFGNLFATSGKNGNFVTASDNGYIRELMVTEGQKVSPGQPLVSLVMEHNLILKADLSPENIDILPSVESANFRVGYSAKIYKIKDMNGRKISHGKSTGDNSFYIPVYFRMDYDPDLIEGTFAEVFLIGKKTSDVIVVPNTALLEEFGKLYVFVADDDGDFIKRYITTGYSDGERTMILSGLKENEKIVATGAYSIKLSKMSTTAPAHNHDH